jgi:hypothetical protein
MVETKREPDSLYFFSNKEKAMTATISKIGNKPCILCEKCEDTAEVKFKDGRFAGVLCKEHLWALLKRNGQKPEETRK